MFFPPLFLYKGLYPSFVTVASFPTLVSAWRLLLFSVAFRCAILYSIDA